MKIPSFFILILLFLPAVAPACDICSSYTPPIRFNHFGELGFYSSLAEQFTHFGSLRFDGEEVANPGDESLDSSITQLIIAHIQTTLPQRRRHH